MVRLLTILSIAMMFVVALVITVAADRAADMKQACDTCSQINTGGNKKSKNNYICPKSSVKSCNININGWCCSQKRESAKCKACWDLDVDEEDDEDEI